MIESPRLLIREARLSDDQFFIRLLNDPDYIRNIRDAGVRTPADAQAFIESRLIKSYREHGSGLYVIELKGSAIPVGICGFVHRSYLPHPDLGYALLKEYRGQGFVNEACLAVLEYGREALSFTTILAITVPANGKSIEVLKRLGFAFVDTRVHPPSNELLETYRLDLR